MTITTHFNCAQCGAVAATLTLNEQNQLIQEGFAGVITEGIAPTTRRQLTAAILAADAAALYRMDQFWAPFYCPTCKQVYCYNHWTMQIQFDDDFPGWYDCTYGVCPQGHRRLLDD